MSYRVIILALPQVNTLKRLHIRVRCISWIYFTAHLLILAYYLALIRIVLEENCVADPDASRIRILIMSVDLELI
jgi:hypothetical protein